MSDTRSQSSISASVGRVTREEAYACYAGDAFRSLQEVARLLRVPLGTIKRWAHEESWAATVKAEDEARSLLVRADTDAKLVKHLAHRIARMEELSEQNANLSVAESATRYLLGISGLVPLQRSQIQVQPPPATRDLKELVAMTDEELDVELRRCLDAV